MSYKERYHTQVSRDIKRLDKPVLKELFDLHIPRICEAPATGDQLYGELQGVFSYHFQKNRVDYRIAYITDDVEKIVTIVMVGTRERFYETLKRRVL